MSHPHVLVLGKAGLGLSAGGLACSWGSPGLQSPVWAWEAHVGHTQVPAWHLPSPRSQALYLWLKTEVSTEPGPPSPHNVASAVSDRSPASRCHCSAFLTTVLLSGWAPCCPLIVPQDEGTCGNTSRDHLGEGGLAHAPVIPPTSP